LAELAGHLDGKEKKKTLLEAVAALESTLQIPIQKQEPPIWGMAQTNLGSCLGDLAKASSGAEARNFLSRELDAHKSALEFYTLDRDRWHWALNQDLIGLTLTDLAQYENEERSKLLSQAVAAHKSALQVYTATGNPVEWLQVNRNLANALTKLSLVHSGPEGKTALTEALGIRRATLASVDRDAMPFQWAGLAHDYGTTLILLATKQSDKESYELMVEAVDYFRAALQVHTTRDKNWAAINHNLGYGLKKLADQQSGEQKEHFLLQAVEAFKAALPVLASEPSNKIYSHALFDLAASLALLAELHDFKDHQFLNEASEAYAQALMTTTQSDFADFPVDMQVYLRFTGIDSAPMLRRKDLQNAYQYLQMAVTRMNKEDAPKDWARSHLALGITLIELSFMENEFPQRETKLTQAFKHFQEAQLVFNPTDDPVEYAHLRKRLTFVGQALKIIRSRR